MPIKVTDTHVFFYHEWLSNFWEAPFEYKGHTFFCNEQAFMWEKAVLFGDKAMEENDKINEMNAAMHNSVWAEQTADAEKKMMEDEAKALKIAMRIGKGDIVPQKDESFLMTTKPDLYKMAKMQALTAEEHKKQKSLMDDEEEQKEYDWDRGHDDTLHRIELDVAIDSEGMSVAGISEVAVSSGDISGSNPT